MAERINQFFQKDVDIVNGAGGVHVVLGEHVDVASADNVAHLIPKHSLVGAEGYAWNQADRLNLLDENGPEVEDGLGYKASLEVFLHRKHVAMVPFDHGFDHTMHPQLEGVLADSEGPFDPEYEKIYEAAQHDRELRAVIGGIAFMAEYLRSATRLPSGLIVSYGAQHRHSLPRVMRKLGVDVAGIAYADPFVEKYGGALSPAQTIDFTDAASLHQAARHRLEKIASR